MNNGSSHRKQHATPRGGFTLVEMLVVMVTFSFLLVSVAMSIAMLLRSKDILQAELTASSTLSRLEAQLRVDAHQAATVQTIGDDGNAMVTRLQLPEQRIDYALEAGRLIRRVYRDGKEQHREVFVLPEAASVNWELSEQSPPLLTLSISYGDPANPDLNRKAHHAEAIVGLHRGATE